MTGGHISCAWSAWTALAAETAARYSLPTVITRNGKAAVDRNEMVSRIDTCIANSTVAAAAAASVTVPSHARAATASHNRRYVAHTRPRSLILHPAPILFRLIVTDLYGLPLSQPIATTTHSLDTPLLLSCDQLPAPNPHTSLRLCSPSPLPHHYVHHYHRLIQPHSPPPPFR